MGRWGTKVQYTSPVSPIMKPIGDWTRKIWGWTRPVFTSDTCLVFEAKTLQGYQCSRHFHERRSNRFIVLTGTLGLELESAFGVSRHLLHPGDVMDIHPPDWHRFQSFEPSLFMEIYYARDGSRIDINDIIRDGKNLGSRIKPLSLA